MNNKKKKEYTDRILRFSLWKLSEGGLLILSSERFQSNLIRGFVNFQHSIEDVVGHLEFFHFRQRNFAAIAKE